MNRDPGFLWLEVDVVVHPLPKTGEERRANDLRLLRTFAGVLPSPPGKNSYARHFKGKHSKQCIV